MSGEPKDGVIWRFGAFEMDGRTAELRRNGVAVKLQEQPSQLLLILLEHAGQIVTREDLRRQLWPADTFVDFDHALNTAVMKLRESVRDSPERPVYIQTIPRKGYRFVAPVTRLPAAVLGENVVSRETVLEPQTQGERRENVGERLADPKTEAVRAGDPELSLLGVGAASGTPASEKEAGRGAQRQRVALIAGVLVLVVGVGVVLYRTEERNARGERTPITPVRSLTRLTFDDGLQSHPTWSPDGRFLAYNSDKGGTTNIWVQQISGGDPIQVTKGPGPNWQPDWSPDGRFIAYRSEAGAQGIFVIPALGGAGQERMIAPYGYDPRWSPDGSRVLFQSGPPAWKGVGSLSVVGLDGEAPREVLRDFFSAHKHTGEVSATWHPDGRRVTVWVVDLAHPAPDPSFWTMSLDGKEAVETTIPSEIRKNLQQLLPEGSYEWTMDSRFRWAPTGDALYFELTRRGARSIWRLAVDPKSLKATGLERMTTGGTLDTAPAISPDGEALAFTAASGKISAWMYPLNSKEGKITGTGRPVTSAGIDAWLTNVTRDGSRLAFSGTRSGQAGLWVKSLPDGAETPLFLTNSLKTRPEWSPDGRYLAYVKTQHDESQIMIWSEETRQEEPLTSLRPVAAEVQMVFGWSPDGKTILITKGELPGYPHDLRDEMPAGLPAFGSWAVPVASAPHAELQERLILSDPHYQIYQARFSPDGSWIVFEAVTTGERASHERHSTIFAARTTGGPWVELTPGENWADKPRWSPDGRMIYFVAVQGGFFDVWAKRFDPERGQSIGKAFRVTSFDSPSLSIPGHMGNVEISVTEKSLVLTLQQVTGSIWILNTVAP